MLLSLLSLIHPLLYISSYETVNINLQNKPDWFLALNPLGQVPVLQLDDQVVPESTATCDWLDDVYPETRLQPSDPYRRAWDRVLLEYLSKVRSYRMEQNKTKIVYWF